MKFKQDFVTNSSSSSFIVVFPKKIETLVDTSKFIMFKEKAECVLNDSLNQEPIKIDFEEKEIDINLFDFIHAILRDRNFDKLETDEITSEIRNKIKDIYSEIIFPIDQAEYIIIKLKSLLQTDFESFDVDKTELIKLIKENNKGFIYTYKYSDEDGDFWSQMEHGGTFENLPHIRISHH